jgi:hypothetical protein
LIQFDDLKYNLADSEIIQYSIFTGSNSYPELYGLDGLDRLGGLDGLDGLGGMCRLDELDELDELDG